MWLKEGADVVTAAGDKVGSVDRVVMNPVTKEITHLVVRRGFLFTEDRVVPMEMVASGDESRVLLREDIHDFEAFPIFQEEDFVIVDRGDLTGTTYSGDYAPPSYWYPALGGTPAWGPTFQGGLTPEDSFEPPRRQKVERNIPDDTVPLQEGAKVISEDGEHVGSLERVMMNDELEQATHFVITQGVLMKEKKLIPVDWVADMDAEQVVLGVSSRLIDRLPEYKE